MLDGCMMQSSSVCVCVCVCVCGRACTCRHVIVSACSHVLLASVSVEPTFERFFDAVLTMRFRLAMFESKAQRQHLGSSAHSLSAASVANIISLERSHTDNRIQLRTRPAQTNQVRACIFGP